MLFTTLLKCGWCLYCIGLLTIRHRSILTVTGFWRSPCPSTGVVWNGTLVCLEFFPVNALSIRSSNLLSFHPIIFWVHLTLFTSRGSKNESSTSSTFPDIDRCREIFDAGWINLTSHKPTYEILLWIGFDVVLQFSRKYCFWIVEFVKTTTFFPFDMNFFASLFWVRQKTPYQGAMSNVSYWRRGKQIQYCLPKQVYYIFT